MGDVTSQNGTLRISPHPHCRRWPSGDLVDLLGDVPFLQDFPRRRSEKRGLPPLLASYSHIED
jgi:hypothetical protein